ncbi:MAG TPA: hypothetical protein VFN89_03605, partial [Solirubrobacterales bacterium]|nr:hypothetical protein [Solirubrobacterales bacterium]
MNAPHKPPHSRRLGLLAALTLSIALLGAALAAAPAMAAFGLESFDVSFANRDGSPATQAGSHPYEMTTSFELNHSGAPAAFDVVLDGEIKDLAISQAAGFIGDPGATPKCPTADFATQSQTVGAQAIFVPNCHSDTAVGLTSVRLSAPPGGFVAYVPSAVYNLQTAPGVVARLGFWVLGVPVVVDVGVEETAPFRIRPVVSNTSQALEVLGARLTLWGYPGDSSHDSLRGDCLAIIPTVELEFSSRGGECSVEGQNGPFLTVPGSCTGPALTSYETDSWQNPGVFVKGGALTHDFAEPPAPQGFTGCGRLAFIPEVESKPSADTAETGTGLDFSVDFDQGGLTSPAGLAQSEAKKAEVTLPEGVTINPSIGEGLGVCTPAEYASESLSAASGEGCPDSSKIGSLHIDTPVVDEGIDGSVYLAEEDNPETTEAGAENPFDSLIALYLVLRNPNLGVLIKLPLKVEPDPKTGRLVASLENIPQLPFDHFNFHFKEGVRAALVTPPTCGGFTTEAKFWPWSDPTNPRTVTSSFEITKGVGGGPCPPNGIPPFDPHFQAGAINNNAGSFSPFDMRITREDGEQDMTKFSAVLPPGELGSLAGVSKCP